MGTDTKKVGSKVTKTVATNRIAKALLLTLNRADPNVTNHAQSLLAT